MGAAKVSTCHPYRRCDDAGRTAGSLEVQAASTASRGRSAARGRRLGEDQRGGVGHRISARVVRRRRIAAAVVASALVIPGSVFGLFPHLAAASAAQPARTYTVRPGDTLWSIASSAVGGGDPRPYVQALEQQIGGDQIFPGERIALPPG